MVSYLSINIALKLEQTFCGVLSLAMHSDKQRCEAIVLRPQSDQPH